MMKRKMKRTSQGTERTSQGTASRLGRIIATMILGTMVHKRKTLAPEAITLVAEALVLGTITYMAEALVLAEDMKASTLEMSADMKVLSLGMTAETLFEMALGATLLIALRLPTFERLRHDKSS